jgi:fatty-acyl-CoA synthase
VLSISGVPIDERSNILPVVPMFHVNAWGTPYFGLIAGVKLVFPGPGLDGENLANLIEDEQVTDAWGVPTVWLGLLGHMREKGKTFSSLKRTLIGGSALPKAMIEEFKEKHNVDAIQGWGMTEMSPLGTVATVRPSMRGDWQRELKIRGTQGRLMFGVEMKIVDGKGNALPHDGESTGEVVVRSPWLTQGYTKDAEKSEELWQGGWLHTGDIGYVDEEGYLQITDRLKDVIKTGGEWISSLTLEDIISQHEAVSESAAIGVADEKWGERPLVLLVVKDSHKDKVTEDELRDFFMKFVDAGEIPKYGVPNRVQIVDEIPKTSVGKINKKDIRTQFTS